MKISESAVQIAVFKWAKLYEGKYPELKMLMATPNQGAKNSGHWMSQRVKEGLKKGFPDMSLLVPKNGYHGLFIEAKLPQGRASSSQIEWIDRLNFYGYKAVIMHADNPMVIIRLITDYLSIELID